MTWEHHEVNYSGPDPIPPEVLAQLAPKRHETKRRVTKTAEPLVSRDDLRFFVGFLLTLVALVALVAAIGIMSVIISLVSRFITTGAW